MTMRRVKSFGVSRWVFRQIVRDVSKEPAAFIFRVKQYTELLLGPQIAASTLYRTPGIYVQVNTASQSRLCEYLADR
jgi:hypothetical protein